MAWEETKEDLLKLMQVNCNIFGDEILQIESAKEEWLINYFEKKLGEILDQMVLGGSPYGYIESDGWRGITDCGLKNEGFKLNIHQCIKIFYYISSKVYPKRYSKGVQLHWVDSTIVINYIKDGYPLDESAYKLVKNN